MTFQTSLKNQIILFSAIVVLITSVTSLASFWWSTSEYNEKRIEMDIDNAENVYEQYLAAKENLLITAARVLTADFGFKTAVATNDAETIASVLTNHGQRIQADLMLLTDLQGRLVSSSSQEFIAGTDMANVVKTLLASDFHARFIQFDNVLYQVIILPVKAPRAIAFNLIGFRINQQVTDDLKQVTGLEVSFIGPQKHVFSSSLERSVDGNLVDYFTEHKVRGLLGQRVAYVNRTIALNSLPEEPVSILLSASLQQNYDEFDRLLLTFVALAAVAMVLCLLISSLLARNLTVPLSRLVVTARRFARGDYASEQEDNRNSSEIRELFAAFSDMGNEIQQREQQILYQSQHDSLTGLFNRHVIQLHIEKLVDAAEPFWVLVLDIKGLKQINDKLGPQIGDDCIQVLAKRLVNFCDGNEEHNARIGGDEFLMVLPVASLHNPDIQVDNLLDKLAQPYRVRDLSLSLQISCGVVKYPQDAADAKSILRRATIACDAASNANLPLRFYQAGEDEAHLERIAIVEDLKNAIEMDDGQLFMAYQPKVRATNGKVEKVEALIRWINKDGKFIPPDVFIELAEQAGLIIQLTQWVINTVVAQIKSWQQQDVFINASINVSAQDLTHADFLEYLQSCIEFHQLDAGFITIELTERDMMEDEQKALAVVEQLKSHGFTLSVDDYGVGQSSLSKLKQLPLDELKIDKSFILTLDQSPGDQIIVKSTILLGHELGFTMVAEGVENLASYNLLKEFGCDQLQGYFISRPLSAADFIQWLANYENH
ncbi:putative bifunctional diguanylate cyclase/phosphodiesterase [Neptunicella marina]|uniref:EAL domain-containing protein n=1 Tax=Neptunicella marina TaxID=2125989 RepID=A0A8J6IRK0_9ALTE|nr:EAL domain-containing protein [Neptunicella marina]MBC3764328.1 EAL domain-containing protein [Neptunicella marina]